MRQYCHQDSCSDFPSIMPQIRGAKFGWSLPRQILGYRYYNLFSIKVCGCYLVWFHVLKFFLIRFTQQNLCCIRVFTMKTLSKPHWDLNLPWLTSGYWKCMFVDFLVGYIDPLNCVHYRVYGRYYCFKTYSNVLYFFLSLWCLLVDPHRTTYLSNLGVRLRDWAT